MSAALFGVDVHVHLRGTSLDTFSPPLRVGRSRKLGLQTWPTTLQLGRLRPTMALGHSEHPLARSTIRSSSSKTTNNSHSNNNSSGRRLLGLVDLIRPLASPLVSREALR